MAKPSTRAKRKQNARKGSPKRSPSKWRFLLNRYVLGASALLVAGVSLYGFLAYRSLYDGIPDLPSHEALWAVRRAPAIEFRGKDGAVIAVRGPRYGQRISVGDLPVHIPQAFIAAEDKRFYEHDGVDTTAIIRAAWSNWRAGRTVSGASTITQQVVKNLVLTSDQRLSRKAQEVRLARELETQLTKTEILELYLNRIYFGSGAYGLDAAAQEYFSKDPKDLSLAEAALLATLPKAPSRLALDNNLEEARARQAYVLNEMVNGGLIGPSQKVSALEEEIVLATPSGEAPEFGYVLDSVMERLPEILPERPSDLVVTLTLDGALQRAAHEAVTSRLETEGAELNASQAAALILDKDGSVLAMIGGRDYGESQFNRVTQARRQPGSAFKALVFAAALESGVDPYDVRSDTPVTYGDWTPKNYLAGHYGPITVSEAFAKSLNTVAARIGHEVGEEAIITLAQRFGVRSPLRPLPSIALGSQELSLFELTRAFGVFATEGTRVDPYTILRVEDSRGQTLYARKSYKPLRVYKQRLARQMNGMLARVAQAGTGTRSQVEGWTVAGKTGTSQDSRDAWFVGFTAKRIAGVWVGNDDDSPMDAVTGGGLPADLWADLMTLAHQSETVAQLPGAQAQIRLSDTAKERISFYRGLAGAFRGIEDVKLVKTEPAQLAR